MPRTTSLIPMHRCADLEGDYRYALSRIWDPKLPLILWAMLNPSVADADIDDPTIGRCIRFTQAWGYGGLVVGNLYAIIETYPENLVTYSQDHRVGPRNDRVLDQLATRTALVVCAWGAHRVAAARVPAAMAIFRRRYAPANITALALNKDGSPRHPLYLPSASTLVAYAPSL